MAKQSKAGNCGKIIVFGEPGCTNPRTRRLHACPYDADVNNDPTPTCRCCDDCADRCADDI